MRTLSPGLAAHFGGSCLTLADVYRIERLDGTVLGFTSDQQPLLLDGVTYVPVPGLQRTADQSTSGLAVAGLDFEVAFMDSLITERDVRAGLYDGADVTVGVVNYMDVGAGMVRLRTGFLGEPTISDGHARWEVRGLQTVLGLTVGENYSITCRADFGDTRCKFALSKVTWQAVVESTDGRSYLVPVFPNTAPQVLNAILRFGTLRWSSGENCGLVSEIKSVDETGTGRFTLFDPTPFPLAPGDTATLIGGCDRSLGACRARDNVLNFRGFPYVPGVDRVGESPNYSGG